MSVDVYLIAFDENRDYNYLREGIPSPSVWFGDDKYLSREKNLLVRDSKLIDDNLIEELLNWPRSMNCINVKELEEINAFLMESKGKFLKIYIG